MQATYDQLMALITGRPGDDGAAADPEALVDGDARASARERVHVYAHMYRARMVEALESQFPRLARWMGADAFTALTCAYVTDRPSRHPSLRFMGRHLPDWLATRAPAGEPHAARAALARLEWARADVFDAADDTTLALDAVRAWPVEAFGAMPLRLIGAHRLVTVTPAAAGLWDAIGAETPAADTDPGARAAAIEAVSARPAREEALLIWRQGVSVFHRAIDAAEHAALQSVAGGTTLGAVCEALSRERSADDATAQAFAWLSTWATDELLISPGGQEATGF